MPTAFISPSDDLSFIETTALTVAHYRGLEDARPDRLFTDPLAAAFVEAAGEAGGAARLLPAGPPDYFSVRTRFFDDYVTKACNVGCRQVVILAAGLDARAFRLPFPPGVRLFEVELGAMLRFKEDVLTSKRARARCDRIVVPVDLREDWPSALAKAGFHDGPTAWLVEGLLFYLTRSDCECLLRRMTRLSTAGSWLGIEHVNQAVYEAVSATVASLAEKGAPWLSSIEEPGAWLEELGWKATVCDQAELATRHGRTIGFPAAAGNPKAWLIEASVIEASVIEETRG